LSGLLFPKARPRRQHEDKGEQASAVIKELRP
jgi:hypothetical protein